MTHFKGQMPSCHYQPRWPLQGPHKERSRVGTSFVGEAERAKTKLAIKFMLIKTMDSGLGRIILNKIDSGLGMANFNKIGSGLGTFFYRNL